MPQSQKAITQARTCPKASHLSELGEQMPTDDSVTMEAEHTSKENDRNYMANEDLERMRKSRSDSDALDQAQVGTSETSRVESTQTVAKRAKTHVFPRCPSGYFQHAPLQDPKKQIRLVKLLPADSDEIILLACKSWWLDDKDRPPYRGISYTWGDVQTQLLFVNGKALHVRKNCYYALWQARLHFPGTWVWIDSICINQSDDNEKSHQVQMMYGIYSTSALVLSCVGPHADNSELLVEATREVLELLLEYEQPEDEPFPGTHVFDRLKWASTRSEGFFINLRKSLESFSERPYWSRLWIVQEMCAAGWDHERGLQVLCGNESIELWALKALDWFFCLFLDDAAETLSWNLIAASEMPRTALQHTLKYVTTGTALVQAEGCFRLVQPFRCSDPRDKLYGILCLIEWPDGFEAIKPDYEKSAWDVFLYMAHILPPSEIMHALEPLALGISEADLRIWARRRSLIEAVRTDRNCSLSDSAQRLGIKSYQRRSIPIINHTPLATLVAEHNLGPLSRSVIADIEFQMRQDIKTLSGMDCKSSDVAPYLPFGVFAGEDLIFKVDHRAREGDLILNLGDFLLVVRHKIGSVYDVVGPAEWFKVPNSKPDIGSQYQKLHEQGGDQCCTFYAKGSLALSLEDQLAFAGLSRWSSKPPVVGELSWYSTFATRLFEQPDGAVDLDLTPVCSNIDRAFWMRL